MTSLRQIDSNRRNALKSTGPKTEDGKQRASRNAVRHGLTAETVFIPFEDVEDHKAFELAITTDYNAETAVERELVLRLANLLWRLRRAISIETGLLQIQGEMGHEPRQTNQIGPSHDRAVAVFRFDRPAVDANCDQTRSDGNDCDTNCRDAAARLDVARCFMRLANLDNGVLEQLGRYETTLWRQTRQTLCTLQRLRWPIPSAHRRQPQHPWEHFDR